MNPSISFLWGEQSSAGGSGVRPLALGADCVQQPSLRGNCVQHPAPGARPGAFPHSAVSPAASARQGSSGSRTVAIHRAAFTLVELLLVIGIIGLLAAISVPVVMQSLAKARNAAIKAEIDMLHMAIMNYKNEYGSFPPSLDVLVGGAYSANGTAARHIDRIFPRCANTASQLNAVSQLPTGGHIPLTPLNALTAWLMGYTTNPQSPLVGERQKLFDFDAARVNPATGAYCPSGKPNSPFIYIDSSRYIDSSTTPAQAQQFSHSTNIYFAQRLPVTAVTPVQWNVLAQPPFNADTFQILCAGRDEEFGTDDDLSNFWPGTRREYLDSLRN